METRGTIQLKEFCRLFRVEDRQVRYILEAGHVPDGVRRAPSTGNRREFDPGQAFWLAIVVKLKQVGLKTPLAAEVADVFQGHPLWPTRETAGRGLLSRTSGAALYLVSGPNVAMRTATRFESRMPRASESASKAARETVALTCP